MAVIQSGIQSNTCMKVEPKKIIQVVSCFILPLVHNKSPGGTLALSSLSKHLLQKQTFLLFSPNDQSYHLRPCSDYLWDKGSNVKTEAQVEEKRLQSGFSLEALRCRKRGMFTHMWGGHLQEKQNPAQGPAIVSHTAHFSYSLKLSGKPCVLFNQRPNITTKHAKWKKLIFVLYKLCFVTKDITVIKYIQRNTYCRNRSKFSLKQQLKTLKHPTRRILVVGTNTVFSHTFQIIL